MHSRSFADANRRWLPVFLALAVALAAFVWSSGPAEAVTGDAQQSVVPGTDLSDLERTNQEWDTKNQHRIWWNSASNTWDAVLPASTAVEGVTFPSEWWIVRDVMSSAPQYVALVSDGTRDRPDVYWDDQEQLLYVLMSGGPSTTLYRFEATGATYQKLGQSNVPGMDTSTSRAAVYKSGTVIWVSMMDGGGLYVSRSTDDGQTWPTKPVTLMVPIDEGQTQLTELNSGAIAVAAAEDGRPPTENERLPAYWFFALSSTADWETTLASGTVTISTQPNEGDSITIGRHPLAPETLAPETKGPVTYVFTSTITPGGPNQVKIGADVAETRANLVAAINGEAGAGTIYSDDVWGHPDVIIDDFIGDSAILWARIAGPGGNSITTTGTVAGTPAFSASTLQGGAGEWTWNRIDVQSSTKQTHADDELSLVKAQDGTIYIATETDRSGPLERIEEDPQVILLVRNPSTGAWAQRTIKYDQRQQSRDRKRPVVTIANGQLYVFTVNIDQNESSYWTAPVGPSPTFGDIQPFIHVGGVEAVYPGGSELFRNHIVPREPRPTGDIPVLIDNLHDLTVWKAKVPRASANQPPSVELGDDKVVAVGTPAVITPVHAKDDNVGGNTTWQWSKVSGPGTATFSAAPAGSPAHSTTVKFSAVGDYVLRLTATEAGPNPLSNYDDVLVTVQASNQAPALTLQNPKNNEKFNSGQQITFRATASDPEAGDLTTDIRWTSNRDGFLGAGSPVVRSDLSKGTHTITASVSDGQHSRSASVTIVVGAASTPPGGPAKPGDPGKPGQPGGPAKPPATPSEPGRTPENRFTDDNGHVFESDIDWLANSGITKGCNPPQNDRFCPDDFVTRGQMAAFLHRALSD